MKTAAILLATSFGMLANAYVVNFYSGGQSEGQQNNNSDGKSILLFLIFSIPAYIF